MPCERQSPWLTEEAANGCCGAGRADAHFFALAGVFYRSCDVCGDPPVKFNEESLRRGWKTRNIGAALRWSCWWWKREMMTVKKKQ